jgi:hypothetical protein
MIKVKAHYKGSDRDMLIDPKSVEVAFTTAHGANRMDVLCVETAGGKSILILDRKLDDLQYEDWISPSK